MVRRMMNAGITRGWSVWVDTWRAKTSALAKLRACGNRLRAPEVTQFFDFWRLDVLHLKAAREAKAAHEREVQAAQARGEDTSFVSKWSRVRRLSMATSVIGAFDRVTRSESRRDRGYGQPDDARSDAKDDGGFSFANLLLRASGSLAPTGWLRSLARPWAWGPPPPVEARL
jgi:hypothetical protein